MASGKPHVLKRIWPEQSAAIPDTQTATDKLQLTVPPETALLLEIKRKL